MNRSTDAPAHQVLDIGLLSVSQCSIEVYLPAEVRMKLLMEEALTSEDTPV